MTFDNLILLVFAPMAAGVVLGCATQDKRFAPVVVAVAFSVVIALIYVLHEKVPPLPPVSSKQKLGLALIMSPVVSLCSSRLGPRGHTAVLTFFVSACFLWLIQRPLVAGRWSLHWMLPILTIALFSLVPNLQNRQVSSWFALPITLLVMSITAGALAMLGGYLGLGQVLISISAFLGGNVLALFLSQLRNPTQFQFPQPALIALHWGLGLMLVQLSTFATNLSVPGYLLMLALFLLPVADRKLAPLPTLVQPFVYGVAGFLMAGPAIFMAIWNF